MKSNDRLAPSAKELESNIFELVGRQAAKTPDSIAILAEDNRVSYAELVARADEVCRFLLSDGLKPEEPVGVYMNRDASLVSVLLGIWKAGGAYVPFDPKEPPVRVEHLLARAKCNRVLGSADLLDRLRQTFDQNEENETSDIALFDVATLPENTPGTNPKPCAPGGARLAYLLFTSGSTGEPKAVEVEHRCIANLLFAIRDLFEFSETDRYLAVSTIGFDISVAELFLPLITGASLVMRDRSILLEPKRLAGEIRNHGVTVMQTGPSVWAVLLNEVPDFPRVRVAISTGEEIAPNLAHKLTQYGDAVWNLYGPTETTVWATGHRLTLEDKPDGPVSRISAPIGKPLHGLKAYVIDAQGELLPDGEKGELCLGGAGVARGYRGNKDLTTERFIDIEGNRVYRTGDLVTRDASGVLYFYGRDDDQFKVRGVRIEPKEVEATILQDARVAQAATTWFETQSGNRAIIAAIVMHPGQTVFTRELHASLEKKLPSQMVPARFLFVPWLPISANGKIDRNAIRQAVGAAREDEPVSILTPSLSPTEQIIASVWQRSLKLDSVAEDDHFFAIGGDSLAAVQALVEIEHLLGVNLPIQLVFEAPTLKEFAERIDLMQESNDKELKQDPIFPIVEMPGASPLFFCGVDLSVAQSWDVPCPLYAITLWAKNNNIADMKSIESIAARNIEHVRKVQSEGPYRIGGYSLGGLIAFEMAQQLIAQGYEVELLFLLDPTGAMQASGISNDWQPDNLIPPLKDRLGRYFGRIFQGPGKIGFRRWFAVTLPLDKVPGVAWAGYHLFHLHGRRPNPVSQLLFPRNQWPSFWYAAFRLTRDYVAKPYKGQTLAVFIEGSPGLKTWEPLLHKNTEVHIIDGTHINLFSAPVLQKWMAWLKTVLTRN